MQEEILHQIMDEGLLDGIDLNNLTPLQEEEITERIAHAFRRRQRERSSRRPDSHDSGRSASHSSHSSRPSHLQDSPHARSRTSENRHRREQTPPNSAIGHQPTDGAHHPPARSATDLPRTSRRAHRRSSTSPPVATRRRTTASVPRPIPSSHLRGNTDRATQATRPHVAIPTFESVSRSDDFHNSSPNLAPFPRTYDDPQRPISSSAVVPTPSRTLVVDNVPSVSCSRCGTPNLQHSVHYHCDSCNSGHYNLCLSCYRAGKGCLYWYGFGYAAITQYSRLAPPGGYSPGHRPPHVLVARRYAPDPGVLQQGLFCDGCMAFADECYWHCGVCNDGAWGFCDQCVTKGLHCTHPLQCFGRLPMQNARPHNRSNNTRTMLDIHPAPLSIAKSGSRAAAASPAAPALSNVDLPNVSDASGYVTLSPTSYCDICIRSIPQSQTRFHCNTCNDGNYDICSSCYYALVHSGKISAEDGPQGWRRCLGGHRMSIIGFEDREGGTRRMIVHEKVGGWALKEDLPSRDEASHLTSIPAVKWRWRENDGTSAIHASSTTRYIDTSLLPPNGGVGMRTRALWSYFPTPDAADELSFPRHAIITEVEDINGDWFWGVYAGRKGLFPGNFVKVI